MALVDYNDRYHLPTKGKCLELACGNAYRQGWVNLDLHADKVDVKHDLNKFPYPFKDNTFDGIEATMILEHLQDWVASLMECHRILKPGGKMLIQVPHYLSVYQWGHYDHKHAFNLYSFDPFAANAHQKGGLIQEEMADAHCKVSLFSDITRLIVFPKGKWFWGRPLEIFFNSSYLMQLFWEMWLSGIFKASGSVVVLTK